MQVLIAVDTPKDVAADVPAGERHAGASTPAIRAPIEHARARPDQPAVHSNDAHHGGERESIPPSRHDGSFDGTSSDEAFRRCGIAAVVSVGRHTRRRVRPTAHGALVRGLRLAMSEDAVCVLDGVDPATAPGDPRRRDGATITAGAALTGAGANRAEATR